MYRDDSKAGKATDVMQKPGLVLAELHTSLVLCSVQGRVCRRSIDRIPVQLWLDIGLNGTSSLLRRVLLPLVSLGSESCFES